LVCLGWNLLNWCFILLSVGLLKKTVSSRVLSFITRKS